MDTVDYTVTSPASHFGLLTCSICYKTNDPGLDQAAGLLLSLSPSLLLLQELGPRAFSHLLRRLTPRFPNTYEVTAASSSPACPSTKVVRGRWRNRGFLSARLEVVGKPLLVTCLHIEARLGGQAGGQAGGPAAGRAAKALRKS